MYGAVCVDFVDCVGLSNLILFKISRAIAIRVDNAGLPGCSYFRQNCYVADSILVDCLNLLKLNPG